MWEKVERMAVECEMLESIAVRFGQNKIKLIPEKDDVKKKIKWGETKKTRKEVRSEKEKRMKTSI